MNARRGMVRPLLYYPCSVLKSHFRLARNALHNSISPTAIV
jgi:hypothetical protein